MIHWLLLKSCVLVFVLVILKFKSLVVSFASHHPIVWAIPRSSEEWMGEWAGGGEGAARCTLVSYLLYSLLVNLFPPILNSWTSGEQKLFSCCPIQLFCDVQPVHGAAMVITRAPGGCRKSRLQCDRDKATKAFSKFGTSVFLKAQRPEPKCGRHEAVLIGGPLAEHLGPV